MGQVGIVRICPVFSDRHNVCRYSTSRGRYLGIRRVSARPSSVQKHTVVSTDRDLAVGQQVVSQLADVYRF